MPPVLESMMVRALLVTRARHKVLVKGSELTIDEIDSEVVSGTEVEAQLDDAVLKCSVVKDGDAVVGLWVLGDVHDAVFQIDLLVAFGPPGAVGGPAVADVFFAGCLFIAGKVVGKEQRGLCGDEELAEEAKGEKRGFHSAG